MIGEGEKKHYVLIKDFNTFMYEHTLHRGRKHFCRYWLHVFVTEILKRHIKDCFKLNDKERIIKPKIGEYVKFKNFKRKIKSPFMIYAVFDYLKIMENKIQMSLILTNIKNILIVAMVIN